MILPTINQKIAEALKAGDKTLVTTLRLLLTELHNAQIDKKGRGKSPELSDEEEIAIVRKEIKKRKDAIGIYESAGETARVEKEKAEMAILQEFLPAQASDEEIEKEIADVVSKMSGANLADFGKVMGVVMGKLAGRASGDRVAKIVRSRLG